MWGPSTIYSYRFRLFSNNTPGDCPRFLKLPYDFATTRRHRGQVATRDTNQASSARVWSSHTLWWPLKIEQWFTTWVYGYCNLTDFASFLADFSSFYLDGGGYMVSLPILEGAVERKYCKYFTVFTVNTKLISGMKYYPHSTKYTKYGDSIIPYYPHSYLH